MKPVLNTDIEMPKKMFEALCLFETFCVANKKEEVTLEEVKNYLTNLYSHTFADAFKSEYLYQ